MAFIGFVVAAAAAAGALSGQEFFLINGVTGKGLRCCSSFIEHLEVCVWGWGFCV